MTLQQLEEIVRPCFIWDKEQGKNWNVINPSGRTNTETTIGVVVFCGVAHMNGFRDKEIIDHIGVERVAFSRHLNTFKKSYEMEWMADVNSLFEEDAVMPKRIMLKTRLILNSINLKFNTSPIIPLNQLGY